MPRPGPRPYECVRKAWHSERHQAMRGSIIQQIFRAVHETHRSDTRKNKEWLEKLPGVVFKAEEIMYSKAYSEIEYMNQETLWDRLKDAVDNIIRRDETNENGELLLPCIEAALILGCIPVRASRNQRHSNPRRYLIPVGGKPSSSSYYSPALGSTLDVPHPIPSIPLVNSCLHIHENVLPEPLVFSETGPIYPCWYEKCSYAQQKPEPELEPSHCDLSLRLSLFSDNWTWLQQVSAGEPKDVQSMTNLRGQLLASENSNNEMGFPERRFSLHQFGNGKQ